MFFSKYLNILCVFLLTIGICISLASLFALQDVLDENQSLQQKTELLLDELDQSLLRMEVIAEDAVEALASQSPSESDEERKPTIYRLRSTGQNIGVYTADGNLIKLLDVNPKTLPLDIQNQLDEELGLSSWDELTRMIQDITG